ncbi:hypothetical protein BC835DRAFT_1370579 [Cytidiella melzeri]|nr:hypothetical protein BC835DRAFT_1370579 [Cytidiella melzeri]
MPEWLVGIRRMPADASGVLNVAGSVLQPDVEVGTQKGSADETTRTPTAQDADVQVTSQTSLQDSHIVQFGEASFLQEPPRTRESSLRRRNTGLEAPGTPTSDTTDEQLPAMVESKEAQALERRLTIIRDGVEGGSATPTAMKPRVEFVDDNDRPPSGMQTPIKSVHFTPSQ